MTNQQDDWETKLREHSKQMGEVGKAVTAGGCLILLFGLVLYFLLFVVIF